mgnify:FL=1
MEMSGDIKKYMVSAVQGDRATRCVLVKLVNNGEPYMIPDGARAIVNIKKPDGKFVYNKCTYSGNEVTIDLTSQALAASGTAYCNVEIRTADDTQIITSATFEIEIETTQRSDSAIESSNEFTAIEVKVNDLIEKISDTNSAAVKAEQQRNQNEENRAAAEKERQQNEESRAAAEKERQQNEENRGQAEIRSRKSEQKRSQGEDNRNQNEESRAAAEKERQQNEESRAAAEKERQQTAKDATEKANMAGSAAEKIAKEVEQKLKNGELKGEKGDKGDTGEKGATGESGVTMPANGMIALSGDENGNLWCYYSDADNPPQFEKDDKGNIYYILPD